MFELMYKGLKLIPSKAASNEMRRCGIRIADCKKILEEGYDAPRKRAKDKEEKWFDRGNKTYNIVRVKSINYSSNEEIYLVIHVGKFTKHK